MRRSAVAFVLAGALAAALAGCGSNGDSASSTPSDERQRSASPSLSGSITVFAAASLTDAFTEIGSQFEAANPGVTVTFSFGASSSLAEQINAGAPADVFASASGSTMQQVVDAGNADGPHDVSPPMSWRSPCRRRTQPMSLGLTIWPTPR